MKANYLLFIIIFIPILGYTQSGKLFTTDKELSNSLINDVYQDNNSIIWIATEDGLNRYDGSKFTVYKHDKDNSHSILSNIVKVIFEDSQRHLLVGFFNGLQLYNHATDQFKEIPLLLHSGEKFPSHVLSVFERKNGDVLIGTSGQGILLLQDKDGKLAAKQTELIPSDFVIDIYEDRSQNLWVSTEDYGLICLNKDNNLNTYFHNSSIKISSVTEDAQGNLFAGSLNSGLYRYDAGTDSFNPVPYQDNPRLPIKTLYLNDQDKILIGTDGNGLKVLDPDKKRITEGDFNVVTFDFSKSKIHSIIEDGHGNTWVGIYQKGVMLLPSFINNFNYIGYKSISKNWIGSNSITAVFQDHENTLWVGTDNDGVYGIDVNEKEKLHYSHNNHPKSAPSTILSIYEDSYHNLWMGSYLHGMSRLNRKTGEFDYLQDLIDIGLNEVQRVYAIVEDNKKNLWIGTMGYGIYSLNLNSLDIKHFNAIKGINFSNHANKLHNAWVNTLLVSSDEKLYIGTVNGLGCLDLKTNSFVSTLGVNNIFSRYIINSLAEDEQGNIWAGTSEGLLCIDKLTQEVSTFTTDQGLPSNVIQAIEIDSAGNIWLSTNYGISRLNPEDTLFTNYYASDGLQGNEFSLNASWVDKEGQIIFGGLNGLSLFHPSEITGQRKNLEVRITDFYIHDHPVRKGTKSGPFEIIDTTIMHANKFHLSHDDNSFSIEFSVLDFNNPERITYMYSMNSNSWVILQPGTNRIAFNNLSPDNYVFRVKAKDFNTFSEEKAISILISPAWYFTSWAKIIYFVLFIIVGYFVVQVVRHRKHTRMKMMEHEQEEQINQAKLQLYTNISHEIRTPMSLIVSPLKKLMINDKDFSRQKAYQVMNRNIERILLLINQLMDVRKIDQGQMFLKYRKTDLVEFMKGLVSMFEEKAQSKNINFNFHHEVDKLNAWIDPENFDKVILNVLSNAFKFTPDKGKITLTLSSGRDLTEKNALRNYFEIIISDNGSGINENKIERIFERFFQVENTNCSFTEGTGIGLHLTRSIVELHHGAITAENNQEQKGCRFIIRCPLGKDHLKDEEIVNDEINKVKSDQGLLVLEPSVEDENVKVKPKSKQRVLIVDDDEEIRKYIREEFASDYHVTERKNGKEALSFILNNKAPDLVISDIMMPEMDGISLCRKIKNNISINNIPVILLTAKSNEEDQLEGIGIGADAYMMKPFNIKILKTTIQNILKNRSILKNNYSGAQQQKDKINGISIDSADQSLVWR